MGPRTVPGSSGQIDPTHSWRRLSDAERIRGQIVSRLTQLTELVAPIATRSDLRSALESVRRDLPPAIVCVADKAIARAELIHRLILVGGQQLRFTVDCCRRRCLLC